MPMARKPKLGDIRFIVENYNIETCEAEARKRGWDGEDGIMDYCFPENHTYYTTHKSLERAEEMARAHVATGTLFGAVIIDRQVYDKEYEDDIVPEWITTDSWEVCSDPEMIKIAK